LTLKDDCRVAGPPPEEKSSGSGFFVLTDWCGSALEELFRISERKKREAI